MCKFFEYFALILVLVSAALTFSLAEGTEDDASLLMKVLPYLLIDSLNQSEIINNVLKELIHRYPNQTHPRPKAIFLIVHHVSFLKFRNLEKLMHRVVDKAVINVSVVWSTAQSRNGSCGYRMDT